MSEETYYRRIAMVRECYDTVGEKFSDWAVGVRSNEKDKYISIIRDRSTAGAKILNLGCGDGRTFSTEDYRRYDITGIDISKTLIELARKRYPSGDFVIGDISGVEYNESEFSVVSAFYSLIHLPLEIQRGLFARVYRWLDPGGLFVASLGFGPEEEYREESFFGEPLWFFRLDKSEYHNLLISAGFRIIEFKPETDVEFGEKVTFLWIVAEKSI